MIAVIIGPLLILGVIMYGIVQANKQDVEENWVKYRCNPLYMPFAGMIQDEVTTAENFQFCTTSFAKDIFDTLLEPVHLLFKTFSGLLQGVLKDMNKFRGMTTGLQTFVGSFTADMFGKIGNTFGVVIQLFSKIRDLTSRLTGSAVYSVVLASTGVNFLLSIFSLLKSMLETLVGIIFGLAIVLMFTFPPLLAFFIPIGAALGITYSCFHPETIMRLHDGTVVRLCDIRVGDVLRGQSTVTAVMRFKADDIPLYVYNHVIVAGNHLVYEDGKWVYVKDAKRTFMYLGEQPSEIICLNTSDHRILIHNTVFSDYEEIEEPPSYKVLNADDYVRAGNTVIKLRDCHPGMEINDGLIRGVVYFEDGMQLFMDNGDGCITLNDTTVVCDYPDSHNPYELEQIQKRVLAQLNRKRM
jgi:hypothetical protein